MPPPGADELGRPVWSATAADVARSYRRLSVLVHPDKNPGDDAARTAFERLNAAYRALRDAGQLVRARAQVCVVLVALFALFEKHARREKQTPSSSLPLRLQRSTHDDKNNKQKNEGRTAQGGRRARRR